MKKEIEEQIKQIKVESKINEYNISEISISFENDEEKKQKIFQKQIEANCVRWIRKNCN